MTNPPTLPDFHAGPALRTIAMPADTNPSGDIFGGWLLAQMDLAGSVPAAERAQGRVATVGIEAMQFHQPVMVGDEVSCYCEITRTGTTSITVRVNAFARRRHTTKVELVTEGLFTYVALDENRIKRKLPPETI